MQRDKFFHFYIKDTLEMQEIDWIIDSRKLQAVKRGGAFIQNAKTKWKEKKDRQNKAESFAAITVHDSACLLNV